ncbi:tyrosine-type recombinase/integrase [Oribacterium sp. C9]|uniref:tyrosine-type recombinase/integrase n=1 Tax=Oribacterium sp. C9 TaxID=1943579 RepID=UPI001439FE17|nr:tyrosine-type recombinase/integrase [Oribacterium sp. C9]
MDVKSPQSLYGYALDLTTFFEYLKYREPDSFDVAKMTLSDLNKLTPSIIEDYLDYSREYTDKGETKIRSDAAIKRRYSSLSSFLAYYYKMDMIDRNPAAKVNPPKIRNQVQITPSVKTNRNIIDFISNGILEGRRAVFQEKTCLRDTAIVTLIASTGIKVSELVNMNIEDVDLEEHCISIYGRRNQKRSIYISDPTAVAISRYLAIRLEILPVHGHDEALFLSLQAKRLSVRAVEYMVKKYTEAFFDGADHLTPETIHQSFRNSIFMQSMNLPFTADICGLDRNTLLQYYRPYIDDYESRKGQEFK